MNVASTSQLRSTAHVNTALADGFFAILHMGKIVAIVTNNEEYMNDISYADQKQLFKFTANKIGNRAAEIVKKIQESKRSLMTKSNKIQAVVFSKDEYENLTSKKLKLSVSCE